MSQTAMFGWNGEVVRAAPKAPEQAAQLARVEGRLAEAILAWCAASGLEVTGGIDGGVWVLRCRRPLPNLGVVAMPRRSARLQATSAPMTTRNTGRAGASTPRAAPGVPSEVSP